MVKKGESYREKEDIELRSKVIFDTVKCLVTFVVIVILHIYRNFIEVLYSISSSSLFVKSCLFYFFNIFHVIFYFLTKGVTHLKPSLIPPMKSLESLQSQVYLNVQNQPPHLPPVHIPTSSLLGTQRRSECSKEFPVLLRPFPFTTSQSSLV